MAIVLRVSLSDEGRRAGFSARQFFLMLEVDASSLDEAVRRMERTGLLSGEILWTARHPSEDGVYVVTGREPVALAPRAIMRISHPTVRFIEEATQ